MDLPGLFGYRAGYFVAAVILTVVTAALALRRLGIAVGLDRPKVWTEFTVAPDPVITVRKQLRVEGRGELANGTPVSFVVPKASLILALEFASAGRLWTAGKWVRPNVGSRRIHIQPLKPGSSLQASGPLPDHDHA